MPYFTSSSGHIELRITAKQAAIASHPGQCDADVRWLSQQPGVAKQLTKLNPDTVREELREYGAWDDTELTDHNQNLQRLLWLACGDIVEELAS